MANGKNSPDSSSTINSDPNSTSAPNSKAQQFTPNRSPGQNNGIRHRRRNIGQRVLGVFRRESHQDTRGETFSAWQKADAESKDEYNLTPLDDKKLDELAPGSGSKFRQALDDIESYRRNPEQYEKESRQERRIRKRADKEAAREKKHQQKDYLHWEKFMLDHGYTREELGLDAPDGPVAESGLGVSGVPVTNRNKRPNFISPNLGAQEQIVREFMSDDARRDRLGAAALKINFEELKEGQYNLDQYAQVLAEALELDASKITLEQDDNITLDTSSSGTSLKPRISINRNPQNEFEFKIKLNKVDFNADQALFEQEQGVLASLLWFLMAQSYNFEQIRTQNIDDSIRDWESKYKIIYEVSGREAANKAILKDAINFPQFINAVRQSQNQTTQTQDESQNQATN